MQKHVLLIVLLGYPFYTFGVPISNLDTQIKAVNAFSHCLTRVINFNGLNINFIILNYPIILLRHFTFHDVDLLYPFEVKPLRAKTSLGWMLEKILSNENGHISFKNLTSFYDQLGVEYMRSTLTDRFNLATKNTHCEANIYLHPPNQNTAPNFYRKHLQYGTILMDPFWIILDYNSQQEQWRGRHLTTIPKHSLLICDDSIKSSCSTIESYETWMATVLGNPLFNRMSENVFILAFSGEMGEFYAHCAFCDPCNPLKLIYIQKLEHDSLKLLSETNKLSSLANTSPQTVEVKLTKSDDYKPTIQGVLNDIRLHEEFKAELIVYLGDLHTIRTVLPQNSTVIITQILDVNRFYFNENAGRKLCPGKIRARFHTKLYPYIVPNGVSHPAQFRSAGIILQTLQLRFISCHNEQYHWTHQLRGLLEVFDSITWTTLIIIVFTLSFVTKFVTYSVFARTKFREI